MFPCGSGLCTAVCSLHVASSSAHHLPQTHNCSLIVGFPTDFFSGIFKLPVSYSLISSLLAAAATQQGWPLLRGWSTLLHIHVSNLYTRNNMKNREEERWPFALIGTPEILFLNLASVFHMNLGRQVTDCASVDFICFLKKKALRFV